MSENINHILERFENCGENCELGFALRKMNNETAGLLRWAAVSPQALLNLLNMGYENLYRYENLVPINENMVEDTLYGLKFHTSFTFKEIDGEWVHQLDENARQVAYRQDLSKREYLAKKFWERLEDPQTIFVYKPYPGLPISEEEVNSISNALFAANKRKFNPNLLIVNQDGNPDTCGNVFQTAPFIYHGVIEKYVNNEDYELFDYAQWKRIMINANEIIKT